MNKRGGGLYSGIKISLRAADIAVALLGAAFIILLAVTVMGA